MWWTLLLQHTVLFSTVDEDVEWESLSELERIVVVVVVVFGFVTLEGT